ncbi:unnamed protein product [Parnassius mnemosyne]|uniref:FP protein C-terminal domain-containing protein n=1 Tax=Parnassius mnemosyne TaxID=213953 RepID=A0AAV1M0A8_9NEOP
MDKQFCGACRALISDKRYMTCLGCKQKYDLQCANISPQRYRALNDENKRNWRCLECKSKIPKKDNTNTPIRPSHQTESAVLDNADNLNVTLRKKSDLAFDYITEKKLKDVLEAERQELRIVIQSSLKELSDQLTTIKNQCSGYQESSMFISGQYEDFRKELVELKKLLATTTSELKCIREENKSLKNSVTAQAARIKALEDENLRQQQWTRMQNIEITGIPENKAEDTKQIVLKLSQHIGAPIQQTDIDFAHRVQPRRAVSAARARPIVVHLRQRAVKDKVIAAGRKYRTLNAKDLGMGDETNRVYINEHLTKENKILLNTCKQKAKEINYKFVWTKNCRIFVRKDEASPPIPISSSTDISKIM